MNLIDDLQRKLDRLMMEPDNAYLYTSIGAILFQVEDWSNAERYLRRAYALSPSDRDILYAYTEVLYRRQNYREAASVCRAGLEAYPDDPVLIEKLGNVCYLLGEYEEAEKTCKTLRTISDKVGSV